MMHTLDHVSGSSSLTAHQRSTLLFDIPAGDREEWMGTVNPAERARVRELFNAFREIAASRNLRNGAAEAASRRKGLGNGWSAKTLANLFRAYRDGGYKPGDFRKRGAKFRPGDWRVLLRDWRGASGQPEEFVRWVGEQFAQFRGRGDCVRALYRHIVHEVWLKDQPIPGYGTCTEWCRANGRHRPHPLLVRAGELPHGWSEDTIRRLLPKRKAVRAQLAHGYLAAHAHQPDMVLGDRSNLKPLQFIFLDDLRPDLRCVHFNGSSGDIVYPLLVMALDACSGVDLANVAKPRALKDVDDKSKGRHGVTQDMALLSVIETIRRWGLPPWPITIIHENASACLTNDARAMLSDAFGDRIRFEATGVFRERMTAAGWIEGGGCPWDKGPLESFWRILQTQLARSPGSTGPRYDAIPGDLAAIEKYTLKLIERAQGLPAVIERLRKPLMDFHEAHDAIHNALALLRFRTKHDLQGFDRIREWRADPSQPYRPWAEFLTLSPDEQNAVSDIQQRLESPAERFCKKLEGVTMEHPDPDLLQFLSGTPRPVTVRNGKITTKDTARQTDPFIFREVGHPLLESINEGEEFDGVIADDNGRIVLARAGQILGSVANQARVDRADPDAWKKEAGRVASARVADRQHLRDYYLPDTDEALAALRAHNETELARVPQLTTAASPQRIAAQQTETAQSRKAQQQQNRADAERARKLRAAREAAAF